MRGEAGKGRAVREEGRRFVGERRCMRRGEEREVVYEKKGKEDAWGKASCEDHGVRGEGRR